MRRAFSNLVIGNLMWTTGLNDIWTRYWYTINTKKSKEYFTLVNWKYAVLAPELLYDEEAIW